MTAEVVAASGPSAPVLAPGQQLTAGLRVDLGASGPAWQEVTTRQRRPTFVWPPGRGPASIRVFSMDGSPQRLLWEGGTGGGTARYPASAPTLTPGLPYRVEVSVDGRTAGVVFSVDPGMTPDGPDVVDIVP